MHIIRINNDLRYNWHVFTKDGQPETFDNVLSFQIRLRQTTQKRGFTPYHTIEDNIIKITFLAKDQQLIGEYDIFLHYTKPDASIPGGIATYSRDLPRAFELKENSEGISEEYEFDISTIILKGSDGLTPHIGENGNWHIGDQDTGVRATGNAVINVVNELPDQGTPGEFYATFED